MARTIEAVDITDLPDLRRIAEEVRDTGRPCPLQIGDEEVAFVMPVDEEAGNRGHRPTAEDEAASRASFGSWRGIVDVEQLKRDLAEGRGADSPIAKS